MDHMSYVCKTLEQNSELSSLLGIEHFRVFYILEKNTFATLFMCQAYVNQTQWKPRKNKMHISF